MRIAVDFDGVLHNDLVREEGRRMGEPIAGAYQAMRKLKRDGHELIIYSVRISDLSKAKHVEDWLKYFDIPYDDVAVSKPSADIYLDDHALRFYDWEQAERDIDSLALSREGITRFLDL